MRSTQPRKNDPSKPRRGAKLTVILVVVEITRYVWAQRMMLRTPESGPRRRHSKRTMSDGVT